jgi:hypothetical protein
MYQFTRDSVDLDDLRERLRKMTDAEPLAFGKSPRYMCSREANLGKPPREPFVIQLREARAEWRRRKGKQS